jgi:glutathionylspermidine synthase
MSATNELAEKTRRAAQHVIDNRLYSKMGIPEFAVSLIERSWEAEPPSLYGRFDLMYGGCHPPKLLEYNADTPTSLLKDTAQQAGLGSSLFTIEEIGWDGAHFVGPEDQALTTVFKLYPWEWMVREEFGKHLAAADTVWMEPPWKMLLSNKAILSVLWELYPSHPYLLAASFERPSGAEWVRKPLLGREGENVILHRPGAEIETGGDYGEEGFVYQHVGPLKSFDGMYPVIGSWVIRQEAGNSAAGIGIRESDIPITTNLSRFVPHVCG